MFTRDSNVWNVLFTIGGAAAAGLALGNPTEYGLSPVAFKWLQLVATVFVAAGKLGNSPLKHSDDGDKVTPRA
jgi:hypothetical protein